MASYQRPAGRQPEPARRLSLRPLPEPGRAAGLAAAGTGPPTARPSRGRGNGASAGRREAELVQARAEHHSDEQGGEQAEPHRFDVLEYRYVGQQSERPGMAVLPAMKTRGPSDSR